jgi:hypothetical protein
MHDIRFRGRPIEQLSDTELRAAFKELLESFEALERALIERGVISDGEVARRMQEPPGVKPLPHVDQRNGTTTSRR